MATKSFLLVAVTALVLLWAVGANVVSAQGGPQGAPVKILEPLDTQGNVRVTVAAPVQVTASAPLPVAIQQSPNSVVLTPLAQNVTLQPGQEFLSPWIDAKDFKFFKVYARVTPYSPISRVLVRIADGTGVASEGTYEWVAYATLCPPNATTGGCPVAQSFMPQSLVAGTFTAWADTVSVAGRFSSLNVWARNFGQSGDPDVAVTLYLLMAKD